MLKPPITHALSKFAAIAAAAALAGGAQAAPKPHNPNPPPASGGYATPSPQPSDPHVLYALEQLVTGPLPRELQAQMGPIHTLREVEDLLKANNIAFKWGKAEMSSSQMSPTWSGR